MNGLSYVGSVGMQDRIQNKGHKFVLEQKRFFFFDLCRCCSRCSVNTQIGNKNAFQ